MVELAISPQRPDPGNPDAGDNSLLLRAYRRTLPGHVRHFNLIPCVSGVGYVQRTDQPSSLATFYESSLPDVCILAKIDATGISGNCSIFYRGKPLLTSSLYGPKSVYLGRHDEVIVVKTVDLVGPERNRRLAVREVDVRVMILLFGQFGDLSDEVPSLGKSVEGPGLFDLLAFYHAPTLSQLAGTLAQIFAPERSDPALARNAFLFSQCRHAK